MSSCEAIGAFTGDLSAIAWAITPQHREEQSRRWDIHRTAKEPVSYYFYSWKEILALSFPTQITASLESATFRWFLIVGHTISLSRYR